MHLTRIFLSKNIVAFTIIFKSADFAIPFPESVSDHFAFCVAMLQLELFSLQILHRENIFSAKGLTVDATLLTAVSN